MSQEQEPSDFKSGFVALLGAPNVGKSTLLNQLLGEKISITAPKPQTTRNRILGILNLPHCQAILVDTPGIHKARDSFNKLLVQTALTALNEVDLICFQIDATEPQREVNRYVLGQIRNAGKPALLVVNKVDLLADKRDLLPLIQSYQEQLPFAAVIPISALTGDGVDRLLAEIVQLLPNGPRYYPEDYLTDQPERFLVAELIREKIFHLTHQEVPYAVAVVVEKFTEDPERRRIEIEATIHVERDSQKSIVIGKKGSMLKQIGSQARKDIETLLGCHVFLGLFVRVQEHWRKDRRVLAELGYRPDSRRKA